MRALVITGGIAHAFEETGPALAAILGEHGFATEVTEDVEDGLARLEDADLLVVQCLRWSMTQHEKYAPHREEWAFSLSEAGRQAIRDHLSHGGGLLGVHTACISFDDFEAWGDLLGVAWVWGQSHHPPVCEIRTRRADPADPIVAGVPDFAVVDELYSDLRLAPHARVLLEASADGDIWQPAVVVSDDPARRSAFVAFGHDMRAFAVPAVRLLIGRAARFAAGLTVTLPEKDTA